MRNLFAGGLLLVALFGAPSVATAATCSDYSTQAAAQRAADTRDADGDGIYCETLPCPCLKPGQGGGSGGGGSTKARPKKAKKRAQSFSGRITSVVDGDTIKVRAFGAKRDFYTVRLIGIDTPETRSPVECGGKRATAAILRLAFTDPSDENGDGLEDTEGGDGRRVTISTDASQDTFDRYGRLLAYVTTRSGKLLQTEMLSRGWANTYVYGRRPFARVDRFRRAQQRARNAKRGMYARCGGNFHQAL